MGCIAGVGNCADISWVPMLALQARRAVRFQGAQVYSAIALTRLLYTQTLQTHSTVNTRATCSMPSNVYKSPKQEYRFCKQDWGVAQSYTSVFAFIPRHVRF